MHCPVCYVLGRECDACLAQYADQFRITPVTAPADDVAPGYKHPELCEDYLCILVGPHDVHVYHPGMERCKNPWCSFTGRHDLCSLTPLPPAPDPGIAHYAATVTPSGPPQKAHDFTDRYAVQRRLANGGLLQLCKDCGAPGGKDCFPVPGWRTRRDRILAVQMAVKAEKASAAPAPLYAMGPAEPMRTGHEAMSCGLYRTRR